MLLSTSSFVAISNNFGSHIYQFGVTYENLNTVFKWLTEYMSFLIPVEQKGQNYRYFSEFKIVIIYFNMTCVFLKSKLHHLLSCLVNGVIGDFFITFCYEYNALMHTLSNETKSTIIKPHQWNVS